MPDNLNAAVIAVINKLPLRPDIDERFLEFHALLLEYQIGVAAKRLLNRSTAKQAADQLDTYRKALEELIEATENLSPRALGAVNSDQESNKVRRQPVQRLIPVSGPTSEETPDFMGWPRTLFWGDFIPRNSDELLGLVQRAARDLRASASPEPGRQPNIAPQALALKLGESFYLLTGNKPTRRTYTPSSPKHSDSGKEYGPFFAFVKACFTLAELDVAPERYVRYAVENYREAMDGN